LKWLETPHVKAWWDQEIMWTPALIQAKYTSYVKGYSQAKIQETLFERPIYASIISVDTTPIGYIHYYNKHDFTPEQGFDTSCFPQSCAALDLYIGEPHYVRRGIGPSALILFLETHVFPHFDHAVVDPYTANTCAMKAYEKAGFKRMKTVNKVNRGEITWMMKEK
jgi:aminoglycoside 6'-N-acetyltransferase